MAFPRQDHEIHFQKECLETVIDCPFAVHGCECICTRRNFNKHLISDTLQHAVLIAKEYGELEEMVKEDSQSGLELTDKAMSGLEAEGNSNVRIGGCMSKVGKLETKVTKESGSSNMLHSKVSGDDAKFDELESYVSGDAARLEELHTKMSDDATRVVALQRKVASDAVKMNLLESNVSSDAAKILELQSIVAGESAKLARMEKLLIAKLDIVDEKAKAHESVLSQLESDYKFKFLVYTTTAKQKNMSKVFSIPLNEGLTSLQLECRVKWADQGGDGSLWLSINNLGPHGICLTQYEITVSAKNFTTKTFLSKPVLGAGRLTLFTLKAGGQLCWFGEDAFARSYLPFISSSRIIDITCSLRRQ